MPSRSSQRPFDLPVAVLTAGIGMRLAALLPVLAALWAAIWWAFGSGEP